MNPERPSAVPTSLPIDVDQFGSSSPSSANRSDLPAILIIDDEIRENDALVRLLALEGFLVDCVATGRDGLDMVRSNTPAAIVLDLHLPDILGLTVLSELRRARFGGQWSSLPDGTWIHTKQQRALFALSSCGNR